MFDIINPEPTLKEKAEKVVRVNTIKNYTDVRDIALYVADELLAEAEYLDWDYELNEEKSQEMQLLNKLYKVIHSAVEINSCYQFHEDWRQETKKMLKEFLKCE